MRFVRVNSTKQKVVEINDIPKLKTKTETSYNSEFVKEASETENTVTRSADDVSTESTEEETLNFPEEVSNSFPESVQDSTTVSQEEADKIRNEALRAERLGNASFTLSLMFFVFILFMIVALIIAFASNFSPIGLFLAIGFGLLGFVSLIVSIILGAKSLNAAYNTPRGRKRAMTGIIISSVTLGLMLVNIVLGII